jgi:hypothetical protein
LLSFGSGGGELRLELAPLVGERCRPVVVQNGNEQIAKPLGVLEEQESEPSIAAGDLDAPTYVVANRARSSPQ